MVSSVSTYYANIGLTMAKSLSDSAMGAHLTGQEILNILKKSEGWTDNGDGSVTSGPVTVTTNESGDDVILTAVNPADGSRMSMRISDEENRNGQYSVEGFDAHIAGLSSAQNDRLEEEMSEYIDSQDMYGRKNKAYGNSKGKDGRHGGLDSADASTEANWFIALAEVLGESLNGLANDITKQTDKVKLLKNGQPPFKDSMRLQGLAQQLSFMTQAFMTCLNSIGEAIKNGIRRVGRPSRFFQPLLFLCLGNLGVFVWLSVLFQVRR
jgi:hypothetical protein